MRRRLLAVLGLVIVFGVSGYYFWPDPPPSPWERKSAVQVGDTRTQLYAILGGPPGDYRRDKSAGDVPLEVHENQTGSEMWSSDGGMLYIWFDADDRVTRIHGEPSVLGPSLFKKLLANLGL